MARVIIRYSFEGEGQKSTRGRIRQGLRERGFRHVGTGSFEAGDVALPAAVDALKDVLDEVAAGRLDHLWIYVDEPRDVVD